MEVLWKHIEGFEGIYKISNRGDILHVKKNRLLKPWTIEKGYKKIKLSKNGSKTLFSIHRLVAKHFIGPPPADDMLVMHLDDNPANNYVKNLKWGTSTENNRAITVNQRRKFTRSVAPKKNVLLRHLINLIEV
jgi:hypothetical protein